MHHPASPPPENRPPGDFAEVIIEVRDGKPEITKVPAGVVAFLCDHDEAEELESMGEAYAMKTVRGPVDRATIGEPLLRAKLLEKLGEIESIREGLSGLIDHLTIEDAEELAAAFGSLTDARRKVQGSVERVLEHRSSEPLAGA